MKRQKTYFSGSDSGVGFGIQPDYSGGVDADIDPIIEKHNREASKNIKNMISDMNNIKEYLKKVDENSSVKSRVIKALDEIENHINDYVSNSVLYYREMEFIPDIVKMLNNIGSELRKKENDWFELPLFFTKDIQTNLNVWKNTISKTVNQYKLESNVNSYTDIIKIYETIDNIDLNVPNLFTDQNGQWAYLKDTIDNAVENMSRLIEENIGNIQIEYAKSLIKFNKANEEIKRLKSDTYNLKSVSVEKVITPMIEELPESDSPNYKLAMANSPRICGSCRFFKWDDETSGHCTTYDFTSLANHVCDSWQAVNLTDVHTIVRNEEIVNKNINSARGEFVIGDIAYSKSLRCFGIIDNIDTYGGEKVYGLKLIDTTGITFGTAVTYKSDLQHKNNLPVKRMVKTEQSDIKSLENIDTIIDVIRNVRGALKTIVDNHSDFATNPISNKELLTPLQNQLVTILKQPIFQNITSGQKRKYYRALQNSTVAIGGAREILFECFREIIKRKEQNESSDTLRKMMLEAQRAAYERVVLAYTSVDDSLTMPSATHDVIAPGILSIDDNSKEYFEKYYQKIHNVYDLDGYQVSKLSEDSDGIYRIVFKKNVANPSPSNIERIESEIINFIRNDALKNTFVVKTKQTDRETCEDGTVLLSINIIYIVND